MDDVIKQRQEYQARLDAFKNYNGSDRVVRVEELKKELELKPKQEAIYCDLERLNDTVGGFQRGELVVVSGATGQGKTALLQTLTYGFANQGMLPLWFSYEVVAEDLVERFGGNIPDFALPREIVPSSLQWLEQKIWEGMAKYTTKVVFIDHLHFLISMDQLSSMGNVSLAIGGMMRELKKLALRTQTTIFLVSHLKKTRTDAEPDLGDLRDSSFVAQESDMVFVIFRDKVLDPKTNRMIYGDTFLKVDKNRRKGTLTTIPLTFERNRFFEKGDS